MAKYNIAGGFSDTQDNSYEFKDKYSVGDTGPYIGIVKNVVDPLKMGSLGVHIPALSRTEGEARIGAEPISADSLIWCQYLSPFYGAKPFRSVSKTDPYDYRQSQSSYGMWAVPPDIDTNVLVIFAKGEKNSSSAFWIGCIQEPLTNQQVPGNGALVNTSKAAEATEFGETSKLADYGTEFLPAGEKNKNMYASGETVEAINQWKYPINTDLADQLRQEGLIQDTVRGTTSSSARRESPSAVFGINTPGRIKPDSRTPNIGVGGGPVAVDREIGHSLVMDDGDAAGDNQLTRLRTASGHQLLMHDTEGVVYRANGSGKAFIEMDKDGTISVYSDGGINLRSGRDFNLHSDMNINFHAKGAINFTSEANVALNAEGYVFAMGEKGVLSSAQKGAVRHYGRDGISSYTEGTQLHGANGRIDLAGSQVHFNSVGASDKWGPKWLKPDSEYVRIKITNGLIDIDDDRPFRGPKSTGVDKFGNNVMERGLQVNKIPNKTTVTDFVTHEPYDRQSSTARKKKFINEAMEEIKKSSPNLSSEELKVIKAELLKQPTIKAVADQLGKVVKLNDSVKLPIKNLNSLVSQANDIQKLIEDPKGAAMSFIHGQLSSIKTQAMDFFKDNFKFF